MEGNLCIIFADGGGSCGLQENQEHSKNLLVPMLN